MNNTFIFLRHASTVKDVDCPIENWAVSEKGMEKVNKLADTGIFDDVDIIYSSTEEKAVQTASIFSQRLNREIHQVVELGEMIRPDSAYLPTEEYEEIKGRMLKDLNYTESGWETAQHCLQRFKKAVENIDSKYENKKILVVSHGTVMSLYFALVSNKLDKIFSRWKSLEFGSYGIIKDNKLIKDIL